MKDPPQEFQARHPLERGPALPVTLVVGMPVIEVDDGMLATIVGYTEAYCLYRTRDTEALAVAPWRDIALINVRPAAPLLPADVAENDRRNASAAVLRELLALDQFGLTATQTVALSELVAQLCGKSAP